MTVIKYPVRCDFCVVENPLPAAVVNTLVEARWKIPPGRCFLPRSAGDDPVIVEVWI